METIGSRLDQAMSDAKVPSQAELARRSGVPQPTINRILKGQGKKGPESETLRALAKALNVHLRWLQEGLGPMSLSEAPYNERSSLVELPQIGTTRDIEEEANKRAAELLALAAEMLETYRLASPADRQRIDLAFREARTRIDTADKAKPSAR